jgi:hypothetical protein
VEATPLTAAKIRTFYVLRSTFRDARLPDPAVGNGQPSTVNGQRSTVNRQRYLGLMTPPDPKATMLRYLDVGRDSLLWKLEGLSEYDLRRPLTPTGTNLLGLVKHVASIELGYFGDVFGRPSGIPLPWFEDDAPPNADMWAAAAETTGDIVDLYRRAREHSDATINELDLDAVGQVPWWGEHGTVTLHQILVHVTTETHRHAGHADIVRELIDGAVGLRAGGLNLPEGDQTWWSEYRNQVEESARSAGSIDGSTPG